MPEEEKPPAFFIEKSKDNWLFQAKAQKTY
jgi:hypothetical protein